MERPFPTARIDGPFSIHGLWMGWANLDNGALLKAAEREFDILITTDQNLRYQQALSGRRLAILVLPTTSWPRMQTNLDRIRNILNAMRPGELTECHFDR